MPKRHEDMTVSVSCFPACACHRQDGNCMFSKLRLCIIFFGGMQGNTLIAPHGSDCLLWALFSTLVVISLFFTSPPLLLLMFPTRRPVLRRQLRGKRKGIMKKRRDALIPRCSAN